MAWTLIFPGIYHCFDLENKMPCRPFGACIFLLSLQGASPPAISCRPFRPNFEFPIHQVMKRVYHRMGWERKSRSGTQSQLYMPALWLTTARKPLDMKVSPEGAACL